MKNIKSQSALEFMILVGASLFFLSLIMLVIQQTSSDKYRERQDHIVRDLAYLIQDEINLAFTAKEGYMRSFNVPEDISGKKYEVSLVESMVYIKTTDGKNAIALPIANVTGNITIGNNLIKKVNGQVYINQ